MSHYGMRNGGRPPGASRAALYGIVLGAVAALVSSFLFLAAGYLLISLQDHDPSTPFIGRFDANLVIGLAAVVGAGFLCALVPGSVGGGIIALRLRTLAYRGKLNTSVGFAVGALMGASAGCATVIITELMAPKLIWVARELVVLAVGIAALAGLVQSWWLGRWLRGRLLQDSR